MLVRFLAVADGDWSGIESTLQSVAVGVGMFFGLAVLLLSC